jgi:hypothetical protein
MSDGAAGNEITKSKEDILKDGLMILSPKKGDVVIADCRTFRPEHFRDVPKTEFSVPVLLIQPQEGMTLQDSICVVPRHVLIDILEILIARPQA